MISTAVSHREPNSSSELRKQDHTAAEITQATRRGKSRGPAIMVRDLQDLLTPRVRRCAVALRDINFEFRRLRRRFCCWDVLLRQVQLGGKGGSKCELLAERMDRLCTTVVRTILPEARCELLGNVALQGSAP